MITKVLAVRYPSSVDRVKSNTDHLHTVREVEDVSKIKELFGELLFNDNALYRYNYCMVKHDGRYFIIEATDYEKRTYCRKEISYSPLTHLLA